MRFACSRWVAVVGGCVCIGCGSGGLGRPISEFPTADVLEEFAQEGADPLPPLDTIEVQEWQLQAPGTPLDETSEGLVELLKRAIAGKHARFSRELCCAARETARFYTVHQGFPEPALQSYVALRCGSTLPVAQTYAAYREAPENESDAQVVSALDELIGKSIAEALGTPRAAMGIGYARAEGRAAVIVESGTVQATIKGFSPVVEGDSVTISGRLAQQAETLLGAINSGAYGFTPCQPDRSLKFPDFRVVCPVSEEDEQAQLSVMITEKGRVLMTTVLRALVRRDDQVGLEYRPTSIGNVTKVTSDQAFQTAVLEGLNQVRSEAGLGVLRLEPKQSTTNRRVLGQYFKQALMGNQENAELIALGVMAGWNVNGMIRDGGVLPQLAGKTRNPARFLGDTLDDPVGRWVLLEPQVQSIAIGARVLKPSGLAALLSTYGFFESFDHSKLDSAEFSDAQKAQADDVRARYRLELLSWRVGMRVS